MDEKSNGYRSFDSYREAQHWVCTNLTRPDARYRRWRIVDPYYDGGPPG